MPVSFRRFDCVRNALHLHIPADVIKDEELVLRPEVRLIGNSCRAHVLLGTFGQRARAAIIALHSQWFDDITTEIESGFFGEDVENRGRCVRHQDHVRVVDALPACNRGSVEHLTALEETFIDNVAGHGDVLFFSTCVGET